MSASSNSRRSSAPSDYVPVYLGHGSNAVIIQALVAPTIDDPIPDKASSFDFLTKQLRTYRSSYKSAALNTALSSHFDVNHSIARFETDAAIATLRSAIFSCKNLSGVRFLDDVGDPVATVPHDPMIRTDHITYFVFDSCIKPGDIDARLTDMEPFTTRFALRLPQSDRPGSAPIGPPPKPPDDPTMAASDLATLRAELMGLASDPVDTTDGADISAAFTSLKAKLASLTDPKTARRLFETPQSNLTTASPKMASTLASSAMITGTMSTYTGPLDFLDCQESFDSLFPSPVPLDPQTIDEANSPATTTIDTYLDLCDFELFSAILRQDFVGCTTIDDVDTIRQISARLKRLRLNYKLQGQQVFGKPDDLFKTYLTELPILPDNTSLWGFNLIDYFWNALPDTLQHRLTDQKIYSFPDMSKLPTKTLQVQELRKLREAAVLGHKALNEDHARITKVVTDELRRKPPPMHRPASPAPPTAGVHAAMTSAAEGVMNHYRPAGVPPSTEKVIDPITGYESPYPRGYSGCLGCGSTDHRYRQCPKNGTQPVHGDFYRNFFAHFPEKRRFPPMSGDSESAPRSSPVLTTTAPSPPTVDPPSILRPPRAGIGRGSGTSTPAWMTRARATIPNGPTGNDSSDTTTKRARIIPGFVRLLESSVATDPKLRPMPVRINNGLPAIPFGVGCDADNIALMCLYDTCAAITSGNLSYHKWIVSKYPHLVHSFEQFDDSNPFEAIKLVGAVKDTSDLSASDHGKLTAVVRYHTPYEDDQGHPIQLNVALGDDVTVNTILGWPTIKDLGIQMRVKEGCFYSSVLNLEFNLEQVEAQLGVPEHGWDPIRDFMRPDTPKPSTACAMHARASAPAPETPPTVSDTTTGGYLQRFLTDP